MIKNWKQFNETLNNNKELSDEQALQVCKLMTPLDMEHVVIWNKAYGPKSSTHTHSLRTIQFNVLDDERDEKHQIVIWDDQVIYYPTGHSKETGHEEEVMGYLKSIHFVK